MSQARFLARYDRPPPTALKKAIGANTSNLTFASLLTYPLKDLAGDYVHPSGGDFTPHHADPCIDLEHRRHPTVKGMPVAWARESLDEPGAPYSVKMVPLDFDALGTHTVPIGTEYYDKSCRVSMQVFAMREQGALPASSLEFSPLPGFQKSIGWSNLEGREAYEFSRYSVHRWTVCERGVNPGALVLEKSLRSHRQVPTACAKILADKRVNVAGSWEPLHERILKALLPAGSQDTKGTTVRVENKAMDYEQPDDAQLDTQNETQVDEATPEGDAGPPAKPTVQAHYDFAQGLLDLIDQAESQLESSEHLKGKQFLTKKLEQIRGLAEDIKASGDKIDGELSGNKSDAPEDDSDSEPVGDEIETDDDGVMKGIRPVYRKAIKRFKLADVQKAQQTIATPSGELAPEQEAEYLRRIERAERRLKYVS